MRFRSVFDRHLPTLRRPDQTTPRCLHLHLRLLAAPCSFALVCAMLLGLLPALAVAASGPSISAASAIVIDADSGAVLYERNAEDARPIASLTKLFTTWSAIKLAPPARMMTVEASDLVGEASMGLVAGERLSFDALLHGMLLASGNDAAAVVARELGGAAGSVGFVQQMNADARALGLTNTTLVNPHGLDAAGHLSTARDVAVLALALHRQQPEIEALLGNVSWSGAGHNLMNTNTLVGTVPGVVAGKTGVTPAAGTCLLEVVTRYDRTLIVVTLGSTAQSAVSDAVALIDEGFSRLAATTPANAQIASASGAVSGATLAQTDAATEPTTQQVGGGVNPDAGGSQWLWAGVALLAAAIAISGFGLGPRRRRTRPAPTVRQQPRPAPRATRAQPAWQATAPQPAPVYATAPLAEVGAYGMHIADDDSGTASLIPSAGPATARPHAPQMSSAGPRRGGEARAASLREDAQARTVVPQSPLPVGLLAGALDSGQSQAATARSARQGAAQRQTARARRHNPAPFAAAPALSTHTYAQPSTRAQAERRQVLRESVADWTRDLPALARVPASSGD